MSSSLKQFIALRETFPYAIQLIGDKWYLVDRKYQKISEGYELSEKKILEISKIANKLDGNNIGKKHDIVTGIWFYNDGLRRAFEKKGYLEFFSESINSVKKILISS
ncbi:hypothetical protein [uncultured Chryseobacterium sp.]|uniref:hypothetical protein n=1 Tax=uncultured Chryseobacterium sp. TaxID=259322 RepID=UPI0025CDB2A4|nr:hypothetical protein [uncultured Chryseobacterium sp.]